MPHKSRFWWGAPTRFDERRYERKISWLELFYDLVYVAAISQLTHHLAEHPGWNELAFSFLLFCMLFWSWINGSQYYDLHGSEGIRTRLLTFYQMLAVAAVAITLNDAFEGHHKPFAIAFACLQIMITWLWFSVGFYDPRHRKYSNYYTANYVLGFILLLFSAYSSAETARMLWIAVLLLNLSPPLILIPAMRIRKQEDGTEFSASATIVERFGLFTIIVLAESILGTVSGIAEVKDKMPDAWTAFILSILVSFLLWSLYFDMTSEQEAKPGYGNLQWFSFLHFPLLASLGVVGACIKYMLLHMNEGVGIDMQWLFCIATVVILLTLVGITRVMKEEEEDRSYILPVRRLLIGLSAMFLLIPVSGMINSVLFFLSTVCVLLLIPVIYGVIKWIRYRTSRN